MSQSTYTAVYRVITSGLTLSGATHEHTAGDVTLTLKQELDGSTATLILRVAVRDVSETAGRAGADEVAARFVDTLAVDHADVLYHVGAVQFDSQSYSAATGGYVGLESIRVSATGIVAWPIDAARAGRLLAATTAPRSPITGRAATVRRMYLAALRVPDPVIRYLMLYSVVLLVAEITKGKTNCHRRRF